MKKSDVIDKILEYLQDKETIKCGNKQLYIVPNSWENFVVNQAQVDILNEYLIGDNEELPRLRGVCEAMERCNLALGISKRSIKMSFVVSNCEPIGKTIKINNIEFSEINIKNTIHYEKTYCIRNGVAGGFALHICRKLKNAKVH